MHCIARTITFVEIDFLERACLEKVMDMYPMDQKKVRARILWLAVFRMVTYMGRHDHLLPRQYRDKHGIAHNLHEAVVLPTSNDQTIPIATDAITIDTIVKQTTDAMDARFDALEQKMAQLIRSQFCVIQAQKKKKG